MKIPRFLFLILSLVIVYIISCKDSEKEDTKSIDVPRLRESFLQANQQLAQVEESKIRAYAARQQWPVKNTSSGLFYYIYKQHNKPKAKKGNVILARYQVSLLNGELLYSSREEGLLKLTLGETNTINGLLEGIFLLGQGDKAKFIIPSHLAYGLLGDQKKIPAKASLVYDIELISID